MKRILLLIVCLLTSVAIYAQDSKVYSCAYDGYVNIRQQPSNKSAKLGKFQNGPEGAILLEDLGTWVKIKVGSVTGYVLKRFTQSTPTVAYTGRVSADWIEGVYYSMGYAYTIFNNGYWQLGYNFTGKRGYYIMQKNEVKLITEWELIDADPHADQWRKVNPNEEGAVEIWQINEQNGTLGGNKKEQIVDQIVDPGEDYCVDYPWFTTLEDLKKERRNVAEWMQQRR